MANNYDRHLLKVVKLQFLLNKMCDLFWVLHDDFFAFRLFLYPEQSLPESFEYPEGNV